MISFARVISINGIYFRCISPVSEDDGLSIMRSVGNGEFPGLDLASPIIVDLTGFDGGLPSVSEIRRAAIQRTSLQAGLQIGPIACICRSLQDLTAFRFYCVMSHLTGLRQERFSCAGF